MSSSKADIVIIGGGYSAIAVMAHLAQIPQAAKLKIIAIARDGFDVLGPAYATTRPEHLLNVRAERMSALADAPDHFLNWARQRRPNTDAQAYLPRMLYAEYLSELLAETRTKLDITLIKGMATGLRKETRGYRVTTINGDIDAQQVVLATGHTFGNELDSNDPQNERYITSPWTFNFERLPRQENNIAVIGAGLSALDVIISLNAAGYKGYLTCISGNALMPLPHTEFYSDHLLPAIHPDEFYGLALSRLLQKLRRHAAGHDWRFAMDSLRPYTQKIWQSLSTHDQRRVLTRYMSLWNTHRHRHAGQFSPILEKLRQEKRLETIKARVTGHTVQEDAVMLNLRHPDGAQSAVAFDRVFRCAGPGYALSAHPLLMSLVEGGIVRAHPTGYGLAATEDCSVGENIYALGPLLTGQFFETVAVPDLRLQAQIIARKISRQGIG